MFMEAIRIHKQVTPDVINTISQFMGKRVEIIILPDTDDAMLTEKHENPLVTLRGTCPDIIDGLKLQQTLRAEWDR
jgi:hypothetical protein